MDDSEIPMKRICSLHPLRLNQLSFCNLAGLVNARSQSTGSARLLLHLRQDLLLVFGGGGSQQPISVLLYPEQFNDLPLQEALVTKLCLTKSVLLPSRQASIEDVRQALISSFTIRLSPRWSSLGPWLIHRQQQDFLNMEENEIPLQAIKFTIRNEYSSLSIWAGCNELQMFPIAPSDLRLSNMVQLETLMEDPDAEIHLSPADQQNNRFFYLPKMTAGRLVSISRHLLDSSPFETYTDLRAYWKDQYGYELPVESNGLVYFNVVFPYGTREYTIYTYPSCCVFKRQPISHVPSAQSCYETLNHLRQDLVPILKSIFSAEEIQWNPLEEVDSGVRIPLHVKLDRDLEHDVILKMRMETAIQSKRISKYFPREEQNTPKRTPVNGKITQYFSSQRPGSTVSVRRTGNKVVFKPDPLLAKEKLLENMKELAYNQQLGKVHLTDLRAWLKLNHVQYHPKDGKDQLIALIQNQLF